MKKIALFIATLFSFVACDLATLEPAQTKAFMKFYGDVGHTEGVDLLKLNDGYLLLGNNINSDITTTLLTKVDLNGNLIWNSSFTGNKGSSLAQSADGYFIVGDDINSDPQNTRMSLIKTNLEGAELTRTTLDETNIDYHGTAVTISSINEVVVAGYTVDEATFTDQTFIYGYATDLTPAWSKVYMLGPAGIRRTTSKTIVEDDDGSFLWTSLTIDNTIKDLQMLSVARDVEFPTTNQSLITNQIITGEIGDITSTFTGGGVFVQTVDGENNSIAIGNYNNGVEQSSALISEASKNLSANTVIRSIGGDYVVLGTILNNEDNRTDTDFYITKVGIDGTVSPSSGFTNKIGGTGSETGAAIVEADDGGFVFLGTMLNTNEFKMMMLVKVNSKGELIN